MDMHGPNETLAAAIGHEPGSPFCGLMVSTSAFARMLTSEPPDIAGACEAAMCALRDIHCGSETPARIWALFVDQRSGRPALLVDLSPGSQALGGKAMPLQQASLSHREARALSDAYGSLSRREREVMALVVTGLRNKQVAAELEISEITVKVHRGNVMRKMKARSICDLVRMASKLCLEPPRKSDPPGSSCPALQQRNSP